MNGGRKPVKRESRLVFDASAILALLYRESGHEKIERLLDGGFVSSVNLAEVATKLHEDGHAPGEVEESIAVLALTVIPLTEALALAAAWLRNSTRKAGLSLGDRACLATAADLGRPVVTTDRVWKKLELGLEIRVIR